MIKKTAGLFLAAALMFFSALGASALQIESEADIKEKIQALDNLAGCDLSQFANRSEVIGDRRYNFNMTAAQYQNDVKIARENLIKLAEQAETIKSFTNVTEEERLKQLNKAYQDAAFVLYSMDSRTMNYLYSLMNFMPSISYQKYARKFGEYYNSLDVTDTNLVLK